MRYTNWCKFYFTLVHIKFVFDLDTANMDVDTDLIGSVPDDTVLKQPATSDDTPLKQRIA